MQFRSCTLGGFVPCRYPEIIHFSNVAKTINHPFGNVLYHLSMVICGMVYYCFTHIIEIHGFGLPPIGWDVDVPWLRWALRKSEEMMGDYDPVNVSFCPERVRRAELVKRGRAGDVLERTTLPSISIFWSFDHHIMGTGYMGILHSDICMQDKTGGHFGVLGLMTRSCIPFGALTGMTLSIPGSLWYPLVIEQFANWKMAHVNI